MFYKIQYFWFFFSRDAGVYSVQIYSSYKAYIFCCILQNYYVKFGPASSKGVELSVKEHTDIYLYIYIYIYIYRCSLEIEEDTFKNI